MLVVVVGPIAAGKSTIADLVVRALVRPGRTAAAIDLDDVAFMQRSSPGMHEFWRTAAAVTGAMARTWFGAGADVVVAHGPFFESGGYALLLDGLEPAVAVRHVLLRVPVEVALERVAADPARGMSRDPDFLRSAHDRFRELEPSFPTPDAVFDTSARPAAEIAAAIAALVRPGP